MTAPGASPAATLAVCIGTFHVPRAVDIALLRAALARAPRCLVMLAGAHRPRSPRHPFTWQERAELIAAALSAQERASVAFAPLREGWGADRERAELGEATKNETVRLLHHEGERPAVLPPDWQVEAFTHRETAPPEQALRERLMAADDPQVVLASMRGVIADGVEAALAGWTRRPEWEVLRQELAQITREKAAWSVAPYPVVLVTVDAVLRAGDQVLLIRRGRMPGRGLWALPGGFLDPAETVRDGAIRELVEETRIELSQPDLHQALRRVAVFDDPQRSQRGRVITHAHYFELDAQQPPRVQGSDDAASAEWVSIAQLPAMEARFMDDHLLILDHFLGVLRTPAAPSPTPTPAPASASAFPQPLAPSP